jgi:hypothetical protein
MNNHTWELMHISKIESIMNNHTWELMHISHESKSLGHKWIFKSIKEDLLLNNSNNKKVLTHIHMCQ